MRIAFILGISWILAAPLPGREPSVIADLPFEDTGTTCGLDSEVAEYLGSACKIAGQPYPGGEVAYEIVLNDGNDVRFTLDYEVDGEDLDGDLALILTRESSVDDMMRISSCVANSPDFKGRGAGPEAIPSATYEKGRYFLYVDTARDEKTGVDLCGKYRLRVTGTNPRDDPRENLEVRVTARPNVIAGVSPDDPTDPGNLEHVVTVINNGTSDASNLTVEIRPSLPACAPDCVALVGETPDGTRIRRQIEVLRVGQRDDIPLFFAVRSSAPDNGIVGTTAALLGFSNPETQDSASTTIRRQIDLRLEASSNPSAAMVAGQCNGTVSGPSRVRFRNTIRNLGPSDASNVELQAVLKAPGGVISRFVDVSNGTDFDAESGRWTIPELRACGDQRTCQTAWLRRGVAVEPATDGRSITHELAVGRAAESDRRGDSKKSRTVDVHRQVELVFELTAVPPGPVTAGKGASPNLRYFATLRNDGPSVADDATAMGVLTFPGIGVTVPGFASGEPSPILGAITLQPACGESSSSTTVNREVEITVDSSATHLGEIELEVDDIVANDEACVTPGGRCNASLPEPLGTVILGALHLQLSHGFSQPEVVAGSGGGESNLTYDVVVHNGGIRDVSGVTVELPPLVLPSDDVKVVDPPELEDLTWRIGPLGGGKTKTLTRELTVGPSVPAETEICESEAPTVTADGDPPVLMIPPDPTCAAVRAEADLGIRFDPPPEPDPAFVDANVTYTLIATNAGPSDSTGTRVCVALDEGLDFVASPNGCSDDDLLACGEPASSFSCFLGRLPPGEEIVRFVAHVRSDIEHSQVVTGARVFGETDPQDQATSMVAVESSADLVLELRDADDPVQRGVDEIVYRLKITNLGPSTATSVTLSAELEPLRGPSCPRFCKRCIGDPECGSADFVMADRGSTYCEIRFGLADIPSGDYNSCSVFVDVPVMGTVDGVAAKVMISGKEHDAVENNSGEEATTIVSGTNAADLEVVQDVDADPAVAGRPVTYTITVTNRGPGNATDVVVTGTLLEDVGIYNKVEDCPGDLKLSPTKFTCKLGAIEQTEGRNQRQIRIVAIAPSSGEFLKHFVEVEGKEADPNAESEDRRFNNNKTTLVTPVLSPLVLPYFETALGDTTTLFAVRNSSDAALNYEAFVNGREPLGTRTLQGHESHPADVSDVVGVETGYVGIEFETPHTLSGDYFRLDGTGTSASGSLLLDLDPGFSPPPLCQRVSTGFFADTELAFFLSKNPDDAETVVTGHVYSQEGRLVQVLEIPSDMQAFKLDSREDLDVLTRDGTIEWTFPDGVVGHVTSVFRDGGTAVGAPGFCVKPSAEEEPLKAGPLGPHLLLPFFEVGEDVDTTFTVRNASPNDVQVAYEYVDALGAPLSSETLPLAGHATRVVDLRKVLDPIRGTGLVTLTAYDPDSKERLAAPLLHGEWQRVESDVVDGESASLASGEALVDLDAPAALCRKWDTRFFKSALSTDFLIYAQHAQGDAGAAQRSEALVTGQVFDQGGTSLEDSEIRINTESESTLRTSKHPAADLVPEVIAGSVEWTFEPGWIGYVVTLHRSDDGRSVAVPGICRASSPLAGLRR